LRSASASAAATILRAAAKVMTFFSASYAKALEAVSNASPKAVPNIIDLRIDFSS
jgi:hypothetical protein